MKVINMFNRISKIKAIKNVATVVYCDCYHYNKDDER